MAEDFGDKTEAPTPRRRQEAREQGRVARSPDLTAAVLLLGILMLLNWYGPNFVIAMRTLLSETLDVGHLSETGPANLAAGISRAATLVAGAVAPLFVGAMVVALLVNFAQVGFLFTPKRLMPDVAALNPVKGISKIFGGGAGLMHLLMNTLKLLLVGAAAYSAVHGRLSEIVAVQQLSYMQIFTLGSRMVYDIALRIGLVLLVLALIDYFYQRRRLNNELRMTKQEVKEEMRRMEGDPHVKSRRRQIAQQMALQRLRKAVPTADVVITNPTEFAVALKYDAGAMRAPRVVAKGRGHIAMRIRELAAANGVPILERKPLARALFKMVEVGQEIPEQFYAAVAEILAYVYELSGRRRHDPQPEAAL